MLQDGGGWHEQQLLVIDQMKCIFACCPHNVVLEVANRCSDKPLRSNRNLVHRIIECDGFRMIHLQHVHIAIYHSKTGCNSKTHCNLTYFDGLRFNVID